MSRGCKAIVLVVAGLLALSAFPCSTRAGDKVWTRGGPQGGAVDALAISPNFVVDQTLFAGTNGGGVYKTADGGHHNRQNRGKTKSNVGKVGDVGSNDKQLAMSEITNIHHAE